MNKFACGQTLYYKISNSSHANFTRRTTSAHDNDVNDTPLPTRRENRAEINGGRSRAERSGAQVRAAGRSAICTAIYYPGECITSYHAGWMAFTIRRILCATHTWPHIPRHGRRYLHPAETRPQNRRENMLKDFSRECQALLPGSRRSSSLSAPPTYSHYRERVGYNLKNVSSSSFPSSHRIT